MSDVDERLRWLAMFVRLPNRTSALRAATERTVAAGVELNTLGDGNLRDVSHQAVGRLSGFLKEVDPVLSLAWQLLALQPTDPKVVIQSIVKGALVLLASAKGDMHQALAHMRTWDDVARGVLDAEEGDFFRSAARENCGVVGGLPVGVELLECGRWDDAFAWLSKETRLRAGYLGIDSPPQHTDRKKQRILIGGYVELLFAQRIAECGDLALAWQMMMCDPRRPYTFHAVLPQLTWALEKSSFFTDDRLRDLLCTKLDVWWLGAAGRWEESEFSIFRIADMETANHEYHSAPVAEFDGDPTLVLPWKKSKSVGPSVVVMRKDRCEEKGLPQAWKDLRDEALPLVICRDASEVRDRLQEEYPHAFREVAMLTQDLRSGEPARIKPTLLLSQPGTGKTRLIRRLSEVISPEMYISRFNAAGAFDGMYAGTPKGWSTAQASVPARAIMASRKANPIVLVDEIEKAGESTHNGNLWSAMTPFLEKETSARYRDSGIEAELDLSHVIHLATANSIERLPSQLRDRFKVIKIPAPALGHLPKLAALVMRDLAANDDARRHDEPLGEDELENIGRAWARERFSMRKLQRLVEATLEARDACARRH